MLPPIFTAAFLNRLELFRLHARRSFLGTRQGGHLSPKKGYGIEFADYRQYEMGDSPRAIDWRVFARTERLYIKRFQEEQDLRLLIVCDGSASMTAGSPVKWEAARDITLALSYVALLEQDSVMISAPPHLQTPWVTGGKAIHFCAKSLSEVQSKLPSGSTTEGFVRSVKRAAAQVRFPGLAIIISDFLIEPEAVETMTGALRSQNLDLAALRIIGPLDKSPLRPGEGAHVIDSETGARVSLSMTEDVRAEYLKRFESHRESLRKIFSRNGVRYSEITVPPLSADGILEAVAQSGVVR